MLGWPFFLDRGSLSVSNKFSDMLIDNRFSMSSSLEDFSYTKCVLYLVKAFNFCMPLLFTHIKGIYISPEL